MDSSQTKNKQSILNSPEKYRSAVQKNREADGTASQDGDGNIYDSTCQPTTNKKLKRCYC